MTRDEALSVYIEEGPDAAAKAAEVSVRTIYRWASAEGVSTTAISEKTAAATTAAKERARMVRAEVRAALIEEVAKSLHAMSGVEPKDRQSLAMTVGILLDKYRLEEGEATTRSENKDTTVDLPDDIKRDLRNRFADRVRTSSSAVETEGEVQPATT